MTFSTGYDAFLDREWDDYCEEQDRRRLAYLNREIEKLEMGIAECLACIRHYSDEIGIAMDLQDAEREADARDMVECETEAVQSLTKQLEELEAEREDIV